MGLGPTCFISLTLFLLGLTHVLCATGAGTTPAAVELLIGPELEVQPVYAKNVQIEIDWSFAAIRWNMLVDAISYDGKPSLDPEIQELRKILCAHQMTRKGPKASSCEQGFQNIFMWLMEKMELGDSEKKLLKGLSASQRAARLKGYFESARSSSEEAIRLLWGAESILRAFTEAPAPLHQQSAIEQSVRRKLGKGLYTFLGDPDGMSAQIQSDETIFELVRSPPFSRLSDYLQWKEQIRTRLGIPAQDPPMLGLNPHFHLSRIFPQKVSPAELHELTFEFRVLTALTTIQNTVDHPSVKRARPFAGGQNSLVGEMTYDGNVRLIDAGESGIRLEFRSLAGMSWEDVFEYMARVEVIFREGNSLEAMRKQVRKQISAQFLRMDPVKLSDAVRRSLTSPWDDPDTILSALRRMGGTIQDSLAEWPQPADRQSLIKEKWNPALEVAEDWYLTNCTLAGVETRLR
jgi:hypothetical protein